MSVRAHSHTRTTYIIERRVLPHDPGRECLYEQQWSYYTGWDSSTPGGDPETEDAARRYLEVAREIEGYTFRLVRRTTTYTTDEEVIE